MSRIFFTSDNRFHHGNIIGYCNRPFQALDEMNRVMIDRWNDVVNPEDTVYHLGDFGFFRSSKEADELLNRLNGFKSLVPGNHDTSKVKNAESWDIVLPPQHGLIISTETAPGEFTDFRVVINHYSMASWEGDLSGSLMLYGHHHGTRSIAPRSLDVGVDCWDFRPITLDDILKRLFQTFGN